MLINLRTTQCSHDNISDKIPEINFLSDTQSGREDNVVHVDTCTFSGM